MDFTYHYTKEQEEFRKEVRGWLETNVPADLQRPLDPKHMTPELFHWNYDFRKKLGAKGWLHPMYPKEYGGGGLTAEHAVVINEELQRMEVPLPGHDNGFDLPALMVWGTDEQKKEFLPPRLRGEKLGWQLFTEPGAGSDLASLKTRAVKDGDEWVITGEKVFVGGDVGYATPETKVADSLQMGELFCLAITDPNAPRHRNMGFFYIPGNAEGVIPQTLDLLVGHGKRQVYLDNVRVPAKRVIGGENQGWQGAQTSLEIEHGGGGQAAPRNKAIDAMFDTMKERGLGKDAHLVQVAMDAYIDSECLRLIQTRNFWMYASHQEMAYHGSQGSLWRKESNLRIADAIREVVGLESLVSFEDECVEHGGELEAQQRESLAGAHPGGTIEVQRVIIARRLGVSRTKEKAAATPSTMGKGKQGH